MAIRKISKGRAKKVETKRQQVPNRASSQDLRNKVKQMAIRKISKGRAKQETKRQQVPEQGLLTRPPQ